MENRLIEQFKGFLGTPPLWMGQGQFGMEQFILPPAFNPLPQEKELLNAIPSLTRQFVLGKRMESFFSYLMKSSSEYHLITENLQISRDKITIGEVDFIIENRIKNELLHIEMVYKFYVYDPSFKTEEERWIGPNRKDSLLQKIKKLKEYQFPLIDHKETKKLLNTYKIDSTHLKQKVCFKANLFVPWEMREKFYPQINNSCIRGFWIHLNQFVPKDFAEHVFLAPGKPDWPINPWANEEWVPFSTIYEKVVELHNNKISPLLWMKTAKGKVERFFVVWW